MRNKTRRKTIVIDGIHYFADKPETCRKCFFWKNRKAGCILGTENCYYLAEVIKTEQEKKCENCCYAKGRWSQCVIRRNGFGIMSISAGRRRKIRLWNL